MEEDEVMAYLLSSLHFSGEEATLPAGEDESDDSDEDEDDLDENADDDAPTDEEFVMPAGFVAVAKPAELPRDVKNLYVMMLWSVKDRQKREWNAWEVGKVDKHMPNRALHNYNILWDDGMRGSKLSLNTYHTKLDDEEYTPAPGEWLFLSKLAA
ncbi:hypothetical protein CYMTET_19729 [Cymbomonas tetramitiformis]|uniref:Uncharacterized protein n=1 Tax=Cymbomonas tetramitiformis TaxID=36881 RepID=A0AAE0G605_9CHLO|nr:hypothetical protein CYMTET_19729 [Cymbomonas tetramitiformis]